MCPVIVNPILHKIPASRPGGKIQIMSADSSDGLSGCDQHKPKSIQDAGQGRPSFEVLIQLFNKKIYNLSYRLLGNSDDAADLTQETFVRAYGAYPRFSGTLETAYPWLCRIAVNSCKNRFRELSRRQQYEALSLDDIAADEPPIQISANDGSSNPVGAFERRELEAKVQEAIQALPPGIRVIVVLRDMQGLSYREISDVTGLTLETVKARLFRGRAVIRRRLSSYLSE